MKDTYTSVSEFCQDFLAESSNEVAGGPFLSPNMIPPNMAKVVVKWDSYDISSVESFRKIFDKLENANEHRACAYLTCKKKGDRKGAAAIVYIEAMINVLGYCPHGTDAICQIAYKANESLEESSGLKPISLKKGLEMLGFTEIEIHSGYRYRMGFGVKDGQLWYFHRDIDDEEDRLRLGTLVRTAAHRKDWKGGKNQKWIDPELEKLGYEISIPSARCDFNGESRLASA